MIEDVMTNAEMLTLALGIISGLLLALNIDFWGSK